MKNRGQVLVLFILLLPIILLAFTFIIDIGLLSYTKKNVDTKIQTIIEDSLQHSLTEEQIDGLLVQNIDNIESKTISQNDNSIQITIKVKLQPLFEHIIKQNRYEVAYIGKKVEDIIHIVRK